ncbi:MAG: hypothetical protein ACI80V_002226 [Rhodothermales bacterium]|jgi:hypothetical protein
MRRTLLFAMAFAASACSGPANVVENRTLPEARGPVVHADYETFDVSKYPDQPVAERAAVVHDVPESLWQNRADVGVEQNVAGYRVQVIATLDPGEAASAEATLKDWWARQALRLSPDSPVPAEMQVYRLFRQPYYRVRIGDLTSREVAEELLGIVSSRFAGAFIVPDRVTIRR